METLLPNSQRQAYRDKFIAKIVLVIAAIFFFISLVLGVMIYKNAHSQSRSERHSPSIEGIVE